MTWPEIFKLVLTSPVVTAVIAGWFALGGIWLGLSRFRSERWWERKAAAYATVIEALHDIEEHAKKFVDSLEDGYTISEDWVLRLDNARAEGMEELRKGAGIGSFVMTAKAADILSDAVLALENPGTPDMDQLTYHETRVTSAREAITDLEREAKRDLRV